MKKPNESPLMEKNAQKVGDAKYERFVEQFSNLKNDLIKRYLKSTKKNFDSQLEEDFYMNHVWSFDIGLEFDNAGLVAFTAFNFLLKNLPGGTLKKKHPFLFNNPIKDLITFPGSAKCSNVWSL